MMPSWGNITVLDVWINRMNKLEAENTRLQEQNAQLVFATELLVKELNALKENR